jgi:hypothetical protein
VGGVRVVLDEDDLLAAQPELLVGTEPFVFHQLLPLGGV